MQHMPDARQPVMRRVGHARGKRDRLPAFLDDQVGRAGKDLDRNPDRREINMIL